MNNPRPACYETCSTLKSARKGELCGACLAYIDIWHEIMSRERIERSERELREMGLLGPDGQLIESEEDRKKRVEKEERKRVEGIKTTIAEGKAENDARLVIRLSRIF